MYSAGVCSVLVDLWIFWTDMTHCLASSQTPDGHSPEPLLCDALVPALAAVCRAAGGDMVGGGTQWRLPLALCLYIDMECQSPW